MSQIAFSGAIRVGDVVQLGHGPFDDTVREDELASSNVRRCCDCGVAERILAATTY